MTRTHIEIYNVYDSLPHALRLHYLNHLDFLTSKGFEKKYIEHDKEQGTWTHITTDRTFLAGETVTRRILAYDTPWGDYLRLPHEPLLDRQVRLTDAEGVIWWIKVPYNRVGEHDVLRIERVEGHHQSWGGVFSMEQAERVARRVEADLAPGERVEIVERPLP